MNAVALTLMTLCLLAPARSGPAARLLAAQTSAPARGAAMHEVSGTFDVKLTLAPAGPADGIASRTMEKTFAGGLIGTSKGQMLSGGDPATGNAGYVAIEQIQGKLDGKGGTFALMQIGTMSKGTTPRLEVTVVPGSGTGELSGIYGTMTITIAASGAHSYTFRYALAQ